jgi:hypothetical protein
MNLMITLLRSSEKKALLLIGIELNLHINLGSIARLTIASLVIAIECFYLLIFSLISSSDAL